MKSHYAIATMPKLKISSPNSKTTERLGHQSQMPRSQRHSKKVSFWAGLRVEGGLQPFGIKADSHTRWNDQIYNGGLLEKIGGHQ